MNYVCIDCPSYGTSVCLECGEHNEDERYGEDGYCEHEEDDGGDE